MFSTMETATTDANRTTPQIGDILVSSWGYDQTNVDFYQVIALTKTGASVRLRKVSSKRIGGTTGSDHVVAAKDQFADSNPKGILRRVGSTWNGKGYSCRIDDSETAYLWDGEAMHETAAGHGH